jgi:hypothetical protein
LCSTVALLQHKTTCLRRGKKYSEVAFLNSENMRNKRGGKPPKTEKQKVRYTVNFTETENAEFLAQYEKSGAATISKFIAACVFNRQLKVVKINKAAFDFYVKLK